MICKYLKDLGIEQTDSQYLPKNYSSKELQNQKIIYGFDEREAWYLYITHVEWVYCHCMMFKEKGIANMVLANMPVKFNDKIIKTHEALDIVIETCKNFLIAHYQNNDFDEELELIKDLKQSMRLFTDMLEFMIY